MVNFIINLIKNEYWATTIMSCIPLIELKGGIIFARGAGLSFFMAYLLSFVGSTLVFFPIFFLLIPLLRLLKKIKVINKFANSVENYIKSKSTEAITKNKKYCNKINSEIAYKKLAVFIFVAIPLPMTGVWTGSAISVFLDLKFKEAILPIILGNLVAGLIISILAELCIIFLTIESLDYILYGLFILAAIILIITIIKISKKNKENL